MPVASDNKAISIGVLAVLVATTVCAKFLGRQGICVEVFPDGSSKTLYGKDWDLLLAVYTASEENLGLNSSPERHEEVLKHPSTPRRSFQFSPDTTSPLLIATSSSPQRRQRTFGRRGYRQKLNVRATAARASKRTLLAKKITSGTDARKKTYALRRRSRLAWALRKYRYGGNEA